MAQKATIVKFEVKELYGNFPRIFRTIPEGDILRVDSFNKDGFAIVDPVGGSKITEFVEVVAGCFEKDSNFGSEVLSAYDCDENTTFKGIQFTFNGATVTITEENADAKKIYEEWDATMKANSEKHRLEREAWLKTPEGQEYLAQQRAEEKRKNDMKTRVLEIDKTVEMEFKDDESKKIWDNIVEVNSKNPYALGIVEYARRWAKYMQKLIAEGKTVIEIADKASHDCDIDGITGLMKECAIDALAQCWKYGEELHKWHNGLWL